MERMALDLKLELPEVQDEARRRLIRQATAANQAIVKGNCLMVMQMLTRREVLRSHSTWQLMMKNAMWLAFESRRLQQGFDEREQQHEATVLLDAAEVDSQATDPGDCDSEPQEGESADGDAAASVPGSPLADPEGIPQAASGESP